MKYYSLSAIEQMSQRYRAQFINSLSGFKSINLVGTQDRDGHTNASIVSSVIHLGANPPLMGFIMRPITVTRHTYENILETKCYTFNHLTQEIYRPGHQTSARYPKETSEFKATGLSEWYSEHFLAPYVAESPLRIGLTYQNHIPIPDNGTLLMIGKIEEVWLDMTFVQADGYVDIEGLGSLTVSGLDSYHTTSRLDRLAYAKADLPIRSLSETQ